MASMYSVSSPSASGRPGPRVGQLSAAASRSYNVASVWESSAALTEEQLGVINLLAQSCAAGLYPSHIQEDKAPPLAASGSAAAGAPEQAQPQQQAPPKDSYIGTLEDAVLHNSNQFHKWHTELEAACASETEEKYKQYANLLGGHLSAIDTIITKVDQTLGAFDSLLALHREVSQRSRALSASCEALVLEKDALVALADALRAKLKFFDEFESVFQQFHAAQLSLDNEQFLPLLKRLDECIAYVSSNPQYADATSYAGKFRQLQGRALGMVKTKVQQVLRHAIQQVQAAISSSQDAAASSAANASGPLRRGGSGSQKVPVLAEGADVSLLYVRFRAAAEPSLKGLFKELESRVQRSEYRRLLAECQAVYSHARLQLVAPFVQQRIGALPGQDVPQLMRSGYEHLLRVCQLEAQLFEHFFSIKEGGGPAQDALAQLMEPLGTLLYDVLRPIFVQLQDIDQLCELIDILRHEVLQEQLGRRVSGIDALRPMLGRSLADLQERLTYRCQAFIKDNVASYQPSAEDVDFPGKLERLAAAAQQDAAAVAAAAAAAAAGIEQGSGEEGEMEGAGGGAVVQSASSTDPYSAWYLPLHSTLLVLSKLYRAVDSKIFSGLAQEAVAACTLSVQQASRMVARKAGVVDSQLFVIKHLLLLREQIAPFDVEFSATDIDLDFTHMRDHMRRILSGEISLFTLSSSNAMVQMLNRGGPRVLHQQVDSKRELEKQLKAACESLIMAATKAAVEPMLSFITKVTAVRVASQASPGTTKPLREQAFSSPARLVEMVAKVNEGLSSALPEVVAKMRLYLPSPNTRAILFKPIKSNIAEAHGQVAALLEAEYSPEEVASVPLMPPQQLGALLDGMC